jgi:hypothetical protein
MPPGALWVQRVIVRAGATRALPARRDWHQSRTKACAPLPPGYRPRDVERSLLHRAIRLHRSAFVAAARRRGHVLPRVVERELDGLVGCGVLARGFARVRCGACGHELLVPFSCKRRGLCPSCTARRAEYTAAHLVHRVLPRAPYRQWVFTFPISVRLALSRRPHLVTAALEVCLRVLFAWQRRRMRRRRLHQPACGAVTFVQRFGSALKLNVHFHVLVPDGAFDENGGFVAADPPDDEDVRTLLLGAGRRVVALLRRFFGDDDARRREIDGLLQALDATSATPAPPSSATTPSSSPAPRPSPPRSAYCLDWAALLKRVFAGARRVPFGRRHGLLALRRADEGHRLPRGDHRRPRHPHGSRFAHRAVARQKRAGSAHDGGEVRRPLKERLSTPHRFLRVDNVAVDGQGLAFAQSGAALTKAPARGATPAVRQQWRRM